MEADLPPQEPPATPTSKLDDRGLSLTPTSAAQQHIRRVETETESDPSHPVFQKALEILRREMPSQSTANEASPQSAPIVEPPSAPSSPGSSGTPPTETIPPPLLNAFVYCPRLFY